MSQILPLLIRHTRRLVNSYKRLKLSKRNRHVIKRKADTAEITVSEVLCNTEAIFWAELNLQRLSSALSGLNADPLCPAPSALMIGFGHNDDTETRYGTPPGNILLSDVIPSEQIRSDAQNISMLCAVGIGRSARESLRNQAVSNGIGGSTFRFS